MRKYLFRKAVSLILIALILIPTAALGAHAAGPLIYVTSTEAKPGEKAAVDIMMENTPGIVNLILQVEYDNNVFTLSEIKDGGILGNPMHTPNYSLCPYQLTWENDTAPQNFRKNGRLTTLIFDVNPEAEPGDYDIGLSYDYDNWDIVNFEFEKVRFETLGGIVTLSGGSESIVTPAEDFEFSLDGTKATIVGYSGSTENVVIAETYKIDGAVYSVSAIGESAFEGNKSIKTVAIPATVERIGEYAFYDCTNLVEATVLGENTEIGEKALGYYRVDRRTDAITDGFKIKGYAGLKAEAYAAENGITFIVLEKPCLHSDTKTINAKGATCKEEGYTGDVVCEDCGAEIAKGETTEKLAHKAVIDKAVKATCTKTGKTEGSHCSVCGEVIKAQTKVTKKAHSYKNVVTKADAKNKKNGKITPTCSVCGAKKAATTIYYPKTVTLKYTETTYTGKAIKPAVTVKDSKGNKIAASNYTVSYKSNTNVGKATVTITFKGNYKGTLTKTFKINPKGTIVSKLTAKSKGFTATWKKQATQTSGYEIQYSTSSKFTDKTTKTVKVTSAKTVTKTISKLKAGTKYYVRIRTYKTVSKTNYYSTWSKSLTVTTKK